MDKANIERKLFEKLYADFEDEARGATIMHCNDRRGYARWYKERMFKLCLEFNRELRKEEDEQ